MSENLLRKDQLESSLFRERQLVREGKLKEDNPLDLSAGFQELCEAVRRGDTKTCHEKIVEGVNINARDLFDCTPLILASLCGHYEVCQLLLDSGSLCERDTFQGERCLYNALNDKIKNILLEYDYSKSTDPLQPYAAHIASLLSRDHPRTSDISVLADDELFHLHKFILSARSPYFRQKLNKSIGITTWNLPPKIPPSSFGTAIRYLYMGELPRELRAGPGTGYSEVEVLEGIDWLSKHLQLNGLFESITESDRRMARQRRTDALALGRQQMEAWYRENVLGKKVVVDTDRIGEVVWPRDNSTFADVVLRADEPWFEEDEKEDSDTKDTEQDKSFPNGQTSSSPRSVLYPVHRAMLLRSEFFQAMFSSSFREATVGEQLHIVTMDCAPDVLEAVLDFMYAETADFGLTVAVDMLYVADQLMIDKLKTRAALIISSTAVDPDPTVSDTTDIPDLYDILNAAWQTRTPRLEDFAASRLAARLEHHIDRPAFADAVAASAGRIQARQATDTIELLDDVRFYLGERYKRRLDEAEWIGEEEGEGPVNAVLPGLSTAEPEKDESSDVDKGQNGEEKNNGPVFITFEGRKVTDEVTKEQLNYQYLLDKLDGLLEKLNLDA